MMCLDLIMIRKATKKIFQTLRFGFCSEHYAPKMYGNNKSIVSLSHWWNGMSPRPIDYYVQDTLEVEVF